MAEIWLKYLKFYIITTIKNFWIKVFITIYGSIHSLLVWLISGTVYLMLLSCILLINLKTDCLGSGVIKMLNMITLMSWPEQEADLSFIWNKICVYIIWLLRYGHRGWNQSTCVEHCWLDLTCLSVCMSVCLLSWLLKNYRSKFHEILRNVWT